MMTIIIKNLIYAALLIHWNVAQSASHIKNKQSHKNHKNNKNNTPPHTHTQPPQKNPHTPVPNPFSPHFMVHRQMMNNWLSGEDREWDTGDSVVEWK